MSAAEHARSSGPIGWAERGLVPDVVIRAGIRRLSRQRLAEVEAHDTEMASRRLEDFVRRSRVAAIAPLPTLPNAQHYEVPAEFFDLVLGPHLKYSCCHWSNRVGNLAEAEAEALEITAVRAGIEDGMRVLDLGCGWGSLSLWIAERYPRCRVTAVSNSAGQREHIARKAAARGLDNLRVITADMNAFDTAERFERVVSVEMFEHMRNYEALFERIARWLAPDGRFFMHIFCHRLTAYEFLDGGPGDWMSRFFFSGGIMPSDDLPLRFQRDLELVHRWRWDGRHYERTANAWLANLDMRRERVMPVLAGCYGHSAAELWFARWRIFFMACAELFGYAGGQEWFVSHYLFERR